MMLNEDIQIIKVLKNVPTLSSIIFGWLQGNAALKIVPACARVFIIIENK